MRNTQSVKQRQDLKYVRGREDKETVWYDTVCVMGKTRARSQCVDLNELGDKEGTKKESSERQQSETYFLRSI